MSQHPLTPLRESSQSPGTERTLAILELLGQHRLGLNLSEIARDLDLVYHQRMSAEQVRRYHRGEVDPHDASIEHLAALSGYYRVGISALSPVAFSRLEIAFDLLKRQLRCSSAS
jgi:transcriptional regulator with XRE-family HTH domain